MKVRKSLRGTEEQYGVWTYDAVISAYFIITPLAFSSSSEGFSVDLVPIQFRQEQRISFFFFLLLAAVFRG